ncbi:hypothetical protein LRS10_15465 [Phenylobacterium sp. J426]|uniref:hypothetical protein n=1 Tax=Phenylobacterium sp. J426 TaxID=2898439 RepID=UPI002150CC83|nr:hypothetical protein [Phenylobacterium sp. J426]MCR5875457.1 hypothetical protein [Phenylobacterium sp. J426]
MKIIALAAVAAALVAGPALAQEHNHANHGAAAPAAGKLSVESTTIGEIVKNEKAKAVLEAAIPAITAYYDQIGTMTLAQVAPMSQGAIDDAKLKEIQAEFDKIS